MLCTVFLRSYVFRIIKFLKDNLFISLLPIILLRPQIIGSNWTVNPSSFINFTKSTFCNKFYILKLIMQYNFHFSETIKTIILCITYKIVNNFISSWLKNVFD